MVILGDEAPLEARFGPFGDSANLDAKLVHSMRRMYYSIRNHFRCTGWNSYLTWVMWNLISVRLDAR
jgi:hypothetical protein